MIQEKPLFYFKSKIWIEDNNGNIVFGPGRYRILKAVQRLGSLNAAAKELGMSYKGAWCKIKASEKRIGRSLLLRQRKGSSLTLTAQKLIKKFSMMQQVIESRSNEVYQELMQEELEK
ncbi:MAG: winged helix-turn-helix domain-containing protein [Thermodesulfobacteriota bacterium]